MPDTEDLVKLSYFTNIGKAITSASTLRGTLEEVMRQIGTIFAPRNWSLLLRVPGSGDLRFAIVIGSGVNSLKGRVLSRGTGVAGWIAERGEEVIIEDVRCDPRFDPSMDQLTRFETRSIIGVPLKSQDRVFGVIELINKLDGTPFSAFDLNLLMTIADFAAIAIEKAYYVKALKRVASVDALTGLYNRRSFQRFLDREIERSRRSCEPFAVMMVDIDRFKSINDTHGHPAGDAVLKDVATLLRSALRAADLVCRYGGDEFIAVMPGANRERAAKARDRLFAALARRNRDAPIPISLSIGLHEATGDRTEEIVQFVDEDLYEQKQRRTERSIADVDEHLGEFLSAEELHEDRA